MNSAQLFCCFWNLKFEILPADRRHYTRPKTADCRLQTEEARASDASKWCAYKCRALHLALSQVSQVSCILLQQKLCKIMCRAFQVPVSVCACVCVCIFHAVVIIRNPETDIWIWFWFALAFGCGFLLLLLLMECSDLRLWSLCFFSLSLLYYTSSIYLCNYYACMQNFQ